MKRPAYAHRLLLVLMAGGWLIATPAAGQTASPATPTPAASPVAQHAGHPVLLISIDGLAPDTLFATNEEEQAPDIPVLRQLLAQGSAARRVINVNPTVTNPNHTTLVTGLSPRDHGIFNNRPFAPTAKLPAGYLSFTQITAPTLWGAAHAAGLRTGSVFWPVTQGAGPIDHNLITGNSNDDRQITRDTIALIKSHKPDLLTAHFVSYDTAQHEFGPGSAEGRAAIETIDGAIGQIITAQRQAHPDSVIAVVSDHGFFAVTHQVHLNTAFVKSGLITLSQDADPVVTDWRAFAWYVGGMAMVVLRDQQDAQLRQQVAEFLQQLSDNPEAGIERIHDADALAGLGLAPEADFVSALKPGYRMGNAMTGRLSETRSGGAHGAFSNTSLRPDMHSAFLISGPGIPAGKDLGTIDMRRIAPTLAQEMGLPFPSASLPPLPLRD